MVDKMHWKDRHRKACTKPSLIFMLLSYTACPIIHTLPTGPLNVRLHRLPWDPLSRQLLGWRAWSWGKTPRATVHARGPCLERSLLLCFPFTFPTQSPLSLVMKYSSQVSVQSSSLPLILSHWFHVVLRGWQVWCSASPPHDGTWPRPTDQSFLSTLATRICSWVDIRRKRSQSEYSLKWNREIWEGEVFIPLRLLSWGDSGRV